MSHGAYNGWSFVQMSGSRRDHSRRRRRVASSQGSHTSHDDQYMGEVGSRVPSITIAYPGGRVSEESDPVFAEIDVTLREQLISLMPFLEELVLTLLILLKVAKRRDLG